MINNAKRIFVAVFALLCSVTFISQASAAVIYDNTDLFASKLGESVLDNYENPNYALVQNDAAMSAVLGETTYTSTGFSNLNMVFDVPSKSNFFCAGCASFTLDFTTTSVSDGTGVFGVGFDYANYADPFYHAYVTYGDGSTEDFALAELQPSDTKFFGITSDLMITSIAFGLAGGGSTVYGAFAIDNLLVGSVPEPATIFLLALGALGLLSSRKVQSIKA